MNSKKVSMSDIAKALNISKVSVHKAFTNQLDISEDLREKIIGTASLMGYTMIDPLTKLCQNYFYLISEKFHVSTEQFYFGIYTKLRERLRNIGCTIEMYEINDSFSVPRFISSMEKFFKKNFSVFIAGQVPKHILKDFETSGIPCVCVDYYSEKYKLNFIYFDNYRSGYYLTNYLIKCGHRNLCFFIDINSATTNADKYFGYRKSLLENGIPFNKNMHVNLSLANHQSFLNFELPDPPPTACLFDSDAAAANFIIGMSAQGYKIPDDISIASFDNTDMCSETTPKLTSFGLTKEEIVDQCYNIMLKCLKNKNKTYTFTISPTIHVRDSVKILKKT